MPIFTTTGNHQQAFWLADGSKDFAFFPSGILSYVTTPIPIHLKIGNPAWGATHIEKHSRWYQSEGFESAVEIVYSKLAHSGPIFNTESESKLKVSLRLKPSAILVMEYKTTPHLHFSITTIYIHPNNLDGQRIGHYPGRR